MIFFTQSANGTRQLRLCSLGIVDGGTRKMNVNRCEMENRPMTQRLVKFGLSLLILMSCNPFLRAQADEYRFSFSGIHLQEGERVVGVDVSLKAGSFVTVSGLPPGWVVTIDNDASWQTSLKGDARLGSATLDPVGIQKWSILVHRFEFGDLKFHLSGTLLVTKNFQDVRKIPLGADNFREIH
jgi:hypothetical protein